MTEPNVDPAAPTIGDLAAQLAPILDPDSRDLLTVIEPEESVEATLTGGDASKVAAAAVVRRLQAEQIAGDTVLVAGPVLPVLEFALADRPTDLSVSSDGRAQRWIPDLRPTVPIPASGAPYLTAPLIVDRSDLRMDPEHQNAFLRVLAASIRTIDAAPYDRITVSGECGGRPPSCTFRVSGWMAASGGEPDTFYLLSDEGRGLTPEVDSAHHGALPRALAREAEWIARHDAKGAAAIAAYRTCCGAQWDPARPGQFRLEYTRPCSVGAAQADRPLAATGDCFDLLAIVVDVAAGTVLSIEQTPGP